MKIASWNVNSLKVRLPQVLAWLNRHKPDVLALQETKLIDDNFPLEAILDAGYQVEFTGQKTYNGVATLTKITQEKPVKQLPGDMSDQKRLLASTVNGVRIVNVYVPNGQSVGSEKYTYKLNWLKSLTQYLQAELKHYPRLVVLGDFNIAPYDEDVYDPQKWAGHVLVSEAEREALYHLYELGLKDAFRLFEQPKDAYSWWDYRTRAFSGNRGLRIDLTLVSQALVNHCKAASIDVEPRASERPSDHAPIILVLDKL